MAFYIGQKNSVKAQTRDLSVLKKKTVVVSSSRKMVLLIKVTVKEMENGE